MNQPCSLQEIFLSIIGGIYLLPTIVIFLILNKFVFKEKLIGKKFRKKTNLKNENKPIKSIDKPYEDTNKKE